MESDLTQDPIPSSEPASSRYSKTTPYTGTLNFRPFEVPQGEVLRPGPSSRRNSSAEKDEDLDPSLFPNPEAKGGEGTESDHKNQLEKDQQKNPSSNLTGIQKRRESIGDSEPSVYPFSLTWDNNLAWYWKALLAGLMVPSSLSLTVGISFCQNWQDLIDVVPFENNDLNMALLLGFSSSYLCFFVLLLLPEGSLWEINSKLGNLFGRPTEVPDENSAAMEELRQQNSNPCPSSWQNLDWKVRFGLTLGFLVSCCALFHGISLKHHWQVIEDNTPFENNPVNYWLLIGTSTVYLLIFILVLLPEGTFWKKDSVPEDIPTSPNKVSYTLSARLFRSDDELSFPNVQEALQRLQSPSPPEADQGKRGQSFSNSAGSDEE